MDKQLKIKVSIADRVYPLKINPESEEGIRLAAKKIDEMVLSLESSYAVKDKQDVLAMCALHFASNIEQKDLNDDADYHKALELIHSMIQTADESL